MLRQLFDPGDWLGMKPALDPAATQLELRFAPAAGEVKLRIAVGAGVLAVVAIVVTLLREDGFLVFVACGFGFFGLLNLVYGIVQSGFEKSLLVTDSLVMVTTRSWLRGQRDWREPLASYRGVRLREHHLRRGTVGNVESTKTYHVVELVHDDPRRTVPLHVREDGAAPRDVQEAFARRFGLPALAPDREGEVARAVGELDRPLAAAPAARDPGPPPSGVTLTQRGDELRITVGLGRTGRGLVTLFWCALPLAFGVLVYQLDPWMGIVAGGMVTLFVGMILVLGRLVAGRDDRPRAIVIDAATIRIDEPRPPGTFLTRWLPRPIPERAARRLRRDAVEQVRVDTYTSHSSRDEGAPTYHARLVIEGDEGQLTLVATAFDGAKLAWVRDYLAGVVLPGSAGARAVSGGAGARAGRDH
jgi:hypothetical protein